MKIDMLYYITAVLLSFYTPVNAQDTTANRVIVQTKAGQVRGEIKNGIAIFKAIPFAEPPTGVLRFAAPAKPTPWTGIRDATVAGSTPPFAVPPGGDIDNKPMFGKGWIKGADFLTTNVWTPPIKGEARLPVMVYIYGGAFVLGTSDVPVFDGTSFAKKGVVLVSFNYRLGIEGFLKIKGVPTNIGIRDQIAALNWVQDNIAANLNVFQLSAN